MGRAEQAAAALPQVARIAQQSGPALRKAFQLLSDGALVGPAGSRLFSGMVDRHRSARSGFLEAFDQVHRLAQQSKDRPPRVAAPYIAGPPQGGPPVSAGVHSGKPDHLNLLGIELRRAGRSWQDAGAELSRVLGGLGLSTAPARTIKGAGIWVAGQQGDLNRRRDELLKTDQSRAAFDLDVMAAMGNGPHGKGLLDKAWDQWSRHYIPGLGHGSKELLLQSLAYNPATAAGYAIVDTDGFLDRSIIRQAPALLTGVQHPVEFAKAAVNWDLWKKDPVRAFGETVPSLVITAVTMGGGSGSGASTRLSMALRNLGRHKGEAPDPPPTRGARSLEEAAEQAARTGGLGRQDTRTFPPPVTRPAPPSRPMTPTPRAGSEAVAPDGRPHTGGDGEATSPTRRFGPQELAHLRRLEEEARRIADPFGVRVDYTRRPIDPANAAGFNRAMERVAREYPSVFRDMENIEIQNIDEMRATASGIDHRTLAYSITDRRGPVSQGAYLYQERFIDRAVTDEIAQDTHKSGWMVERSATAEGTFYHEFGHQIGRRILADPKLRAELAQALEKAGLPIDGPSLNVAELSGRPILERGLSRYGGTKTTEMIAEGFAEWKLSPHPRPIASAIGNVIDKHFKGK